MPVKREVKVKAGDAISVYWPAERTWYGGRVESINVVSGICEVRYYDGEHESLNLAKRRYKVKAGGEIELIEKVRGSDGDVSKQLKYIGDVLRDTSDKLPPAGCCSSRKGWWSDWCSGIGSAVEAGSVIALVQVTHDLACQLRPSVTTPWWTAEGENWRGRLRSVKTCEGLVNCVEDIRSKAVNWPKVRELFPNLSASSETE